jgi:hypothetical protein
VAGPHLFKTLTGPSFIVSPPSQAYQAKPNQCEPQFVPTLGYEQLEAVQANLQRIISGHNHVVAITDEGSLYVWGRNDRGQLGLGYRGAEDTEPRFKPMYLEVKNAGGKLVQLESHVEPVLTTLRPKLAVLGLSGCSLNMMNRFQNLLIISNCARTRRTKAGGDRCGGWVRAHCGGGCRRAGLCLGRGGTENKHSTDNFLLLLLLSPSYGQSHSS